MDQKSLIVACNVCEVGLEGPSDPNPQDIFICPACGLAETFEAVQRELGEWVKEIIAKPVQERIATAVDGKAIKFKPDHLPKKMGFRFILIQNGGS